MRQRQWIEVLVQYDFNINYTKGKDNHVVDVLSCKALVLAVTMPNDPLGLEVKESLAQDEYFGRIITLLGQENL